MCIAVLYLSFTPVAVVANGVFLPIKLSVCLQRGFGCVLKQVIGCVLKQKAAVLSQSLTSKSSNVCQLEVFGGFYIQSFTITSYGPLKSATSSIP